jgi:hypothetical protein
MKIFSFATGVNNTGGAPSAANISANFRKNSNGPNGILRGLGETGSWKNQKSKISWHYPFKVIIFMWSSEQYKFGTDGKVY